MALPTQDDLKTLDYQYFGQPFCWLSLKSTLDTDTLDYQYFGQPFWAVMPTEAPPIGLTKQFMYYARQRGRL